MSDMSNLTVRKAQAAEFDKIMEIYRIAGDGKAKGIFRCRRKAYDHLFLGNRQFGICGKATG